MNQLAKHVVDVATGQAQEVPEAKNPDNVRRGEANAKARARSMTPAQRSEHARMMADARWERRSTA